ncbi:hypothetical protein OIU77_016140 [Salix suchowensis]|uniref:Uncharacterized protein n=1 Tax=Salix suchowensis TaxID=1278906 RepID=A0ABQ8ZJR9_9ROSI|nr:hypothetical protein OIU77_016140 [Salix suchowensis]
MFRWSTISAVYGFFPSCTFKQKNTKCPVYHYIFLVK